jgi:hypothetical protein
MIEAWLLGGSYVFFVGYGDSSLKKESGTSLGESSTSLVKSGTSSRESGTSFPKSGTSSHRDIRTHNLFIFKTTIYLENKGFFNVMSNS